MMSTLDSLGLSAPSAAEQTQINEEKEEAHRLSAEVVIKAPEFVHVGYPFVIEATGPEGLTLDVPEVTTAEPRDFVTDVVATYKRGRVKIPVKVRVAAPTSSSWFPLEVGNHWVYDRHKEGRTVSVKRYREIEIVEKVSHPTHVEFRGQIRYAADRIVDVTFLPLNGWTLVKTENGWSPFLQRNKRVEAPGHEAFPDDKFECEIPLVDLTSCTCNARPLGEWFAPAGPVHCLVGGQSVQAQDEWAPKKSPQKGSRTFGQLISDIYHGDLKIEIKPFSVSGGPRPDTITLRTFRRPVAPDSLDDDPYLMAFASARPVANRKWSQTFQSLQQSTPLKLDVAAALLKLTSRSQRETIARSMVNHPERARLLNVFEHNFDRNRFAKILGLGDSEK